MKLKKTIWTLAKIAAVLGINAAVLTVLIADEDGQGAQEANADIAQFMDAKVFASASTGDIVEESGLTPRAYEVNGNTIYFAVGETKMSPRAVLDYYQTQFTAAGVNSKKWLEQPQQKIQGDEEKFEKYGEEARELVHANINGEVVPYFVTDNYVSMGAPIIKADSFKDIFDEWGRSALEDPNRVMKGWRYIDATKTPRGVTRVTSIWADDKFDFKKMRDPGGSQLGINENVPACPGCALVMRTRSKENNEPQALEQYMSQQDPETVAEYYKSAMFARGFELSDTTQTMEFVGQSVPEAPMHAQGRFLAFAKGDLLVNYAIVPMEDGTMVMANESW